MLFLQLFKLNYLWILFALPMQSLVRDYQRVQIGIAMDDGNEYYEFHPMGLALTVNYWK